jgi:hypothetical protein
MSRVANKIVMIARSTTKVVAGSTMPRSATPRAHDFVATLMGTGFAGGLLRCAAVATRYCAAADCGSNRKQPFPHLTATPHRVRAAHEGDQPFAATHALHPIPQNRVRVHMGLDRGFLRIFSITEPKPLPRC